MKSNDVLNSVARPLRRDGLSVFTRLGSDLPDVVVLDPERGILCVDITVDGEQEERADPTTLQQKSRNLRREIPEIRDLPRHAVPLRIKKESTGNGFGEVATAWLANIPTTSFDSASFHSISDRLAPSMAFTSTSWTGFADTGHDDRKQTRIRLDAQQASEATKPIADVKVLTGPAGSGKSLVLLARAKFLSRHEPDWQISVVCYNRVLAGYLANMLREYPNVRIMTIGKWLTSNGYRYGLEELGNLSANKIAHIVSSNTHRSIDALLIDEVQDFYGNWIKLLLAHLKPRKGGALLAGDRQQAIYRQADLQDSLAGHDVEYSSLEVPYRSTKQILDVVSALDSSQDIPGRRHAPEGSPVELIWSASSPEVKADVIEFLAAQHILGGTDWGQMAVLVASKYAIGPIASRLRDLNVPCEPIWSNRDDVDRDMSSNSLKIMTMNSAKGLGFKIVYLVGLDEIKHPSLAKDPEEAEQFANRAKLNLVGPTRAEDALYILYSKENAYIQNLRGVIPSEEYFTWPDDFDLEN